MLGIPPKTAILVVLFLARFGTGHSQGFHPRGTPSFRGGLDLGVVPKDGDVFVVCLFCSLLCFGVFSFFLDDEFNESSRKTRFLFQKNTWAQHEHWVFEPPRAGAIAGGSRGSRLWTVLDCLLLRAWYEVCQVWKETLIVAMLGNCSSDK